MVDPSSTSRSLSRRQAGSLLAGLGTLGVTAPLLAACGSTPTATDPGGTDTTSTAPAGGSSGGAEKSAAPAGLTAASQVPVGGGVILQSANVVVTQPTKGTFKGFSATCTHQGCQVATVSDGKIQCPCHGSEFSITDGSVVGGPAPSPLPSVSVKVDQGEVVQG